jgi:hypothetical protein
MVKHELSTKAIKFKSRDDPSGTRNLLRLHRALEFIVMFMESLNKLEDEEKCVTSAQEAYKVSFRLIRHLKNHNCNSLTMVTYYYRYNDLV